MPLPVRIASPTPACALGRLGLCGVLLLAGLAAGAEPARFAEADPRQPADLILVPDASPGLALLAAPLAARLAAEDGLPLLLAVSSPPSEPAARLIRRLECRRALVLAHGPDAEMARGIEFLPAEMLHVGEDAGQAGLVLARRFWGRPARLVAAGPGRAAGVMASALAARRHEPLLIIPPDADPAALLRSLDELGVETVLYVDEAWLPSPLWATRLGGRLRSVDVSVADRLLVEAIGPDKVSNVIVAAVGGGQRPSCPAAYLAPYLGLHRRSLVVLAFSQEGLDAEARALDAVRRLRVRPRSVTLLGGPNALGRIPVRDREFLSYFDVPLEPCTWPVRGGASPYAVGRIPHDPLQDASVAIAAGLARDRLLRDEQPRLLMVANPKTAYTELPLAETISRATVEEFLNRKVAAEAFYGLYGADPSILDAAARAHLIVYEGHIEDQLLFPEGPLPAETRLPAWDEEARPAGREEGDFFLDIFDVARPPATQPPPTPDGPRVEGLPFVVVQSCHSLTEALAQGVYAAGGAGVLGTATSVHSASGSVFIKAFCDHLLYRDDTLGEAVRDARNYFFCLARLKAQRGHQESGKVYRVALSFQLWADPDLSMFSRPLAPPTHSPVSAAWLGPDRLRLTAPRTRLPECRTEKYVVRLAAAAETAGLVKKSEGEAARRLMPLYYQRVPLPPGFVEAGYARVERDGEPDDRAAFLADPANTLLHVVYLPAKAVPDEQIDLRFVR